MSADRLIDLDYKDGEWVELPVDELEDLEDKDLHDYATRHAVHDLEWALAERVGLLMDDKERLTRQKKIAEQNVFDLDNLVTALRSSRDNHAKSAEDWKQAAEFSEKRERDLQQDKNELIEECTRRDSVEAELRAQLAEVTEELDYLRRGRAI